MVVGASRTGKTTYILQRTAGVQPLLVWDPEGQWTAMRLARAVTRSELVRITRELGPAGRLCYQGEPTRHDFEFFCRVAWAWVRLAPCTIIVEELADVTNPGKAPPGWGVLIRRGLKYGPTIYCTSNTPQESDKTVFRNASLKVSFYLELPQDRAYMAERLGCQAAELEQLPPGHYIARRRLEAPHRGAMILRKPARRRAR